MSDRLRDLWAADAADARGFTPAELERRAHRLHRKLWRRDAIEYAAGAVGIGTFVWFAISAPVWPVRAACIAVILGALVVLRNLWQRRMRTPPEALGDAGAAYYRAELVRQRDMLNTVWRWYIAPVVPGMLLFLLAITFATGMSHNPVRQAAALLLGGGPPALIFWLIHRLNRRAAARLDREITDLDAAT